MIKVILAAVSLLAATTSSAQLVYYAAGDPANGTAGLYAIQAHGFPPYGFNYGWWYGVFDDTDYSLPAGTDRIWLAGTYFQPSASGVLGQTSVALNIGFSLGLRMEIYEYAAGTYNLVDYSVTSPLSSGAQWVSFDFSGNTQLTEGSTYLVWLSLLQSTTKFGNQAHYWLVSGPATAVPVSPSMVMAENTLIDIGTGVAPTSAVYALGTPSLYVTDQVQSLLVPEPASLAMVGIGALGLLIMIRRKK